MWNFPGGHQQNLMAWMVFCSPALDPTNGRSELRCKPSNPTLPTAHTIRSGLSTSSIYLGNHEGGFRNSTMHFQCVEIVTNHFRILSWGKQFSNFAPAQNIF